MVFRVCVIGVAFSASLALPVAASAQIVSQGT